MRLSRSLIPLLFLTFVTACMPHTPPSNNVTTTETPLSLDELEIVFKPALFCSNDFPKCDFDHPGRARQILGKYELRPAFYDANYNQITTPTAPGRYGAVVEVLSEKKAPIAPRNITLFRYPGDHPLREDDLQLDLQFPQRIKLDPKSVHNQQTALSQFFAPKILEALNKDPDAALLLAALSESKPTDPPLAGKNSLWAKDQRWWLGLKTKLRQPTTYRYLAWEPKGLAKNEKWPLVLFLHGSGERGEDLDRVKINGLAKLAAEGKPFPFLIIAPQCPAQEWWCAAQLIELIDQACKKWPVDPNRIYVTGLSMGGYGTWELAAEFPDRFAAIAPVCGAGSPADAPTLKHIPTWIFHGQDDNAVPVERSQEMHDALKQAGANPRLTLYPKTGHDSWTKAYADQDLYKWLLAQRRN